MTPILNVKFDYFPISCSTHNLRYNASIILAACLEVSLFGWHFVSVNNWAISSLGLRSKWESKLISQFLGISSWTSMHVLFRAIQAKFIRLTASLCDLFFRISTTIFFSTDHKFLQLPFMPGFADSWNNPALLTTLHLWKVSLVKLRMEMLNHQVPMAISRHHFRFGLLEVWLSFLQFLGTNLCFEIWLHRDYYLDNHNWKINHCYQNNGKKVKSYDILCFLLNPQPYTW